MDPTTELVVRIVIIWTEVVNRVLKKLRIIVDDGGIRITTKTNIDERIARISEAQKSLIDGLRAIDELKIEAEENKAEIERALVQIAVLEQNKAGLQQELEEVKKIIDADVTTFRQVAGIPSEADITRERNKERIIGFITGVVTSVIASGIFWVISQLATVYFPE